MSKKQAKELESSLERFGLCQPIVANNDGTIIGGHQRYALLKKQGQMEADVYFPERDLTEKEIEELAIRLNKSGGEWDFDLLANDFDIPDLVDWGFELDDFEIAPVEKREKPVTMTITFPSEDELYEAEKLIAPILIGVPGTSYKCRGL